MVSFIFGKVNKYFHLSNTTLPSLFFLLLLFLWQFRRCLLQLLCSRLSWIQHSIKDRPLARSIERPIRPIFMAHRGDGERPKKRVTFSSSSIIFIIANNDMHHQDTTSKSGRMLSEVIQVRPL